jgi:ATP-dependent exoDNAse (exonuclease V) alpha subunit
LLPGGYAAITRAEQEVTLAGDISAFRKAVESDPRVRSSILGLAAF